jgi:hypothetical protein
MWLHGRNLSETDPESIACAHFLVLSCCWLRSQ